MALGFLATTARADEIKLSLPTDLTAPLADALDHLRRSSTAERAAAFAELARQVPTRQLSAPPDLLREPLAVAIDDAGDRVGRTSSRLLRGDPTAAPSLRAELAELAALLALFESVSP